MPIPEFHNDSQLLFKSACPQCPSSDGFGNYDDGHGYCFVCKHYEANSNQSTPRHKKRHRHQRLVDEPGINAKV